ncbi:MAG TPA: MFS transporter [Stackebrandtia sp.]|jgi:MFS family permease|uniref:MFS transporter n=1 Tax=Stackebrandtia sp. TaxID=2023065 RepID=UPI002D25D64A|nr:MFS transporter [Stackebrandtia sp.]HZE40342.1 MFS transporter [Stackebrandtia sp.]
MRKVLGSLVVDTRPLRIPAFRNLWWGGVVTGVGSQMTIVAVPKQIYDITGSSAWVGVSGIVGLVPLLIFGLWGGAIADAIDRRKLLMFTSGGTAVISALLWVQAFSGTTSLWPVMILLAFNQALYGIDRSTRGAVVARIVPSEQLPAAAALSASMSMMSAIVGPLAAGALLPWLGLPVLYGIDTVAVTLAMIAVWRLPSIPPLTSEKRRAGLREVLQGFSYMGTQKVLLASFLMDIIAMVVGMPLAIFPEMAERTFGDPSGGGPALGWLFAAIPIGSLLVSLVSGWVGRVRRQGVAVVVAIAVWGAAMVGFGLSHTLWLAVVFLAIGGGADVISMIYRQSILQTAATDEMRGRMQGAFTVVVAGGPRLAAMTHGWAAAAVGTSAAAAGGGGLVIVGIVIATALLPAFWLYRARVEA